MNKVQWHSAEGNFSWDTSDIHHQNQLENDSSKFSLRSPRGQWVKPDWGMAHPYWKSLNNLQAEQLHDTYGAEVCVTIKSKETGKTYSYASHPVQMAHFKMQAALVELPPLGPLPTTRRSTGSIKKTFGRPIQNLPGTSNTNRQENVNRCQGCKVLWCSKEDKEIKKKWSKK